MDAHLKIIIIIKYRLNFPLSYFILAIQPWKLSCKSYFPNGEIKVQIA